MTRLVEIRAYRLKPGTFATFAGLFASDVLPMLRAAAIDVVAFGGAPDDPDAAFLIRSFAGLEDRQRREDAFYGSDAWQSGPREPILACIKTYVDTVLTLDDATVDGLRAAGPVEVADRDEGRRPPSVLD
jgi:hypothetical protein